MSLQQTSILWSTFRTRKCNRVRTKSLKIFSSKFSLQAFKAKQYPKGYWKDVKNRRAFFDWLASSQKLNLTDLSGWYSVKPSIVKKNGGKTLLDNYYNGSLRLALQDCYPEHKWIDEHFSRSARNKWQSAENQLAFVKQLESKLNIKDLHDWYFITLEEVERAISSSTEGKSSSKLLWKHNNQLYSLLKTVYPQHQWYGWKFAVVPRNYWKSVPLEEAKAFIRDAEEKLGIQNPSDWYSVSHSQLRSAGIRVPRAERSATWNTGMFLQILSQVYPEHKWEKDRFRMSRKLTEQPLLSRNISQLLPETKNNLPSQL